MERGGDSEAVLSVTLNRWHKLADSSRLDVGKFL